ncbi:phage major capsid protein [Aureibacillus halotolerans]|uniref:HK97 family phage major capsid protein n=1 Tax=Aureibacillus halotolerans TaxID=1508390 RepID=A0A4R6U1P7_9BACI|nr:phage major capsid protein [Aureibacillus halotolerans]TDQ39232.1 HK97 family phage major capsid protein [Aureibacillus halotolerans]
MTKKERELRAQLQEMKKAADKLIEDGKTEEARSKMDEMKGVRSQIELLVEARSFEMPSVKGENYVPELERKDPDPKDEKRSDEKYQEEYRRVFLIGLRGQKLSSDDRSILESTENRAMSGDTGEDGGLIVPQDISTQINELKRQWNPLEQYVRVENVATRSGSRVFEANSDLTPFEVLEEMGQTPEIQNPKFSSLNYAIKDYGGILPLPNSFKADTDQNIMAYIARWFAKKSVVTRNSLILALANTLAKKDLKDVNAIKTVLNVGLDPAIKINSIFITNQDGFNFLDSLMDGNGRPLLQPDPTSATNQLLFGKQVVVISNRFLQTTGTTTKKAPLIIGDLNETITLFDRQQQSIASTDVGAGAFETNSTKVRGIEREDVRIFDNEAAVFGQLTITTGTGA